MIVPVMIFWFFNAEKIFPLIFGEGWDSAATISKWLLIWFGSQFVMAPTRSLFLVFDIQRNMLIFDTILGFLRFGLLIGLAENLEALEVVKYFAIVSAIISFSFVVGWYFFLVNKLKLIFN
jgi:O-antigen/teichoic acid export membrane protein